MLSLSRPFHLLDTDMLALVLVCSFGAAPGGQFKGPVLGSNSGFTAMITGLFVIIAMKPEAGPDNGPIMGAVIGSQKQAHTLKRHRPMGDYRIPQRTFLSSLGKAWGAERPRGFFYSHKSSVARSERQGILFYFAKT